jgi:hypothetical protein
LVHSLDVEKHLESCKACARAVENQRTLHCTIGRRRLCGNG